MIQLHTANGKILSHNIKKNIGVLPDSSVYPHCICIECNTQAPNNSKRCGNVSNKSLTGVRTKFINYSLTTETDRYIVLRVLELQTNPVSRRFESSNEAKHFGLGDQARISCWRLLVKTYQVLKRRWKLHKSNVHQFVWGRELLEEWPCP